MSQIERAKTAEAVNAPAVSGSPPPPTSSGYMIIKKNPSSFVLVDPDSSRRTPDKTERLNEAMSLLMAWPKWEIWPFKVSLPILSAAAAIPGALLNTAFRKEFVLGHVGRTSSYLATVGLPIFISGAAHFTLITSDILSQRTMCPVCLQVRAAAVQLGAGMLYPLFLSPIVSFSMASRMKDLYLPKVHKQPRAVMELAMELYRSNAIRNKLLYAGAAQIILAMGMTYLQQNCFYNTLLPIINGEVTIAKDGGKVSKYPEKGY